MKQELSRKERRRLRNREEILAVALELLAEKGFRDVTMREIAGRAEFSTGTLYNLFANKEALFSELMREAGHKIHKEFIAALSAKGDEIARISGFIRCHNRICMERKEGFKLYYAALKGGDSAVSPEVLEEVEALRRDIGGRIQRIFRSGIVAGVFRELDPEAMAVTLRGQLEELLCMLMAGRDEKRVMAIGRQVEDIFMAGIIRKE